MVDDATFRVLTVIIGVNSFHDAAASMLFLNEQNIDYFQYSEDRYSGLVHHYGFPWHSLKLAIESAAKHQIVQYLIFRITIVF